MLTGMNAVYGGPPVPMEDAAAAPVPVPIVTGAIASAGNLPCSAQPSPHLTGAARACYVDLLKADPTASGTVSLVMTVSTAGDVTSCAASGLPGVAACLKAAALGVSFCKTTDGSNAIVKATYSFTTAPTK